MLTPFEAPKNAPDLGLWFSRKFVVVDAASEYKGEILSIAEDDGSYCPWFQNEKGEQKRMYWYQLAYAPQSDVSPEKHALREAIDPLQVATGTTVSSPTEEYKPQVGDVISVRVEGRVAEVVTKDNVYKVSLWGGGELWLDTRQTSEEATLISRKAKRKVTFSQEQIEAIKKWVGPYTLKMSDEEGRSFYEWLKDHGV